VKTHISLRVSNIENAIEFYSAFFGVPPHKLRPGYANFDLDNPALKFALNENPREPGAGALDHLGFQVSSAEELQSVKERLKAAGLATFDETDTTCCYAKQDKLWAHDPDGNEWEVYLLTDDLEDDIEHDHAGNALQQNAEYSGAPILIQPAHRCCG
jgi:catechol 2,3-dioxygenase-like lactoylglutathione lyase family enzyme